MREVQAGKHAARSYLILAGGGGSVNLEGRETKTRTLQKKRKGRKAAESQIQRLCATKTMPVLQRALWAGRRGICCSALGLARLHGGCDGGSLRGESGLRRFVRAELRC